MLSPIQKPKWKSWPNAMTKWIITTLLVTAAAAAAAAGPPAWVPVYPGVKIQNFAGNAKSGSFSFNTPDALSKVSSWYQGKAKALGMTFPPVSGEPVSIMAQDSKRNLNIYLLKNSQNGPHTTGSIAYVLK
jgi:hypothetical protein